MRYTRPPGEIVGSTYYLDTSDNTVKVDTESIRRPHRTSTPLDCGSVWQWHEPHDPNPIQASTALAKVAFDLGLPVFAWRKESTKRPGFYRLKGQPRGDRKYYILAAELKGGLLQTTLQYMEEFKG